MIPFSKKIFLFFRTKNHDFARIHEITISRKNMFRDFVLRVSNSANYYNGTITYCIQYVSIGKSITIIKTFSAESKEHSGDFSFE